MKCIISLRRAPAAPCALRSAAIAYILVDTLRRVGLRHSQLADAAVATIRLKLL